MTSLDSSDYEKLVDARCRVRELEAERKEAFETIEMLCVAINAVLKFVESETRPPQAMLDQVRDLRSDLIPLLADLRKETVA